MALLLASCTPTAKKAEAQAEDFRTRIELCDNTDSLRILVEQAVAYAQTLADKGRVDEAAMYLADIQDAVSAKAPVMTAYFDSAKATVDNLPVALADSVADSVAADSSAVAPVPDLGQSR